MAFVCVCVLGGNITEGWVSMTCQKVSQPPPPQEARQQFKSFNDGCGIEVAFYWKIKSDTFEPLMASDQFALQSSRPISRLLYLWQLPVSLPVSVKPKSRTWQHRPLQPRQSIFGLSAWHFTCHQHYTVCTDNNHLYSVALCVFLPLSQQQLQMFKTIRENASAKKTKINQDLLALSQAELLPSYREFLSWETTFILCGKSCLPLFIVNKLLLDRVKPTAL